MPEGPLDDDWGAELFDSAGAPEEPTAKERLAGREYSEVAASDLFTPQTQEAMTLLAFAIDRLGGALVITKEEAAAGHFRLGFDLEFNRETGGIRIYVHRAEA
jgi:hypothetical protein